MRRSLRLLTLAVLIWTLAALARSASTLPDRGGRAGMVGLEPFLWMRQSPEVLDLERLLDRERPALRRGVSVLVQADAGAGVEASFVWHWAQYLAPGVNFVWSGDVPADFAAEWALASGPVPARANWRAVAREGSATLYRVGR